MLWAVDIQFTMQTHTLMFVNKCENNENIENKFKIYQTNWNVNLLIIQMPWIFVYTCICVLMLFLKCDAGSAYTFVKYLYLTIQKSIGIATSILSVQ